MSEVVVIGLTRTPAGADALARAYTALLNGDVDPRRGLVLTL